MPNIIFSIFLGHTLPNVNIFPPSLVSLIADVGPEQYNIYYKNIKRRLDS